MPRDILATVTIDFQKHKAEVIIYNEDGKRWLDMNIDGACQLHGEAQVVFPSLKRYIDHNLGLLEKIIVG